MDRLKPETLFDLEKTMYADIFSGVSLAWEVLDRIKDYVRYTINPNVDALRRDGGMLQRNYVLWNGAVLTEGLEFIPGDAAKGGFLVLRNGDVLDGASVLFAGAALMDREIEIGPGAVVEPGALIKGPTKIGPRTEVRQGAYIRGSCLVGRACVVGHTTEIKNSIMLDGAKAGHFAYVGDSILGREVNLGAGTKMANLKIVAGSIRIRLDGDFIETKRRKFGAILGDECETGCNSVTSPGTIMGRGCLVAPNATVPSGYHARKTVIRAK